jgi:hypothetical protein
MFKWVFLSIPSVNTFYSGQFKPSCYSPFFPSFPLLSVQQLSISLCPSSTCRDIMHFNIINSHSFFPFLPPEFHVVVPLLQTCSTYKDVYDSVCFFVYAYLLDRSSIYERKHQPFSFWTRLTSLYIMSSNSIHLPSINIVSFFFMAE